MKDEILQTKSDETSQVEILKLFSSVAVFHEPESDDCNTEFELQSLVTGGQFYPKIPKTRQVLHPNFRALSKSLLPLLLEHP